MKTIWWCERVCSKVSSRKRGFWGTHEPQMDKKSSKRSSVSGIPLGGGTWGTMVRLGVVVGLCWVGLAVYAELPSEGEKVASGQVSAERLPPLDEVEKAVLQADTGVGTLRENWEPVVRLLKPVTVQTPDAVYRLIKAHACLAVNENNEAVCLFLTAQIPEAKKQWWEWAEKFYRQHPDSPIAHYYLADAKARLAKWEEAMDLWAMAISKAPEKRHALSANARGVGYATLKDCKKAREELENAIQWSDKQLADAYANVGFLRIQTKEGPEAALRAFNRVLEDDPQVPKQKALSPHYALALEGRACILLVQKQSEAAQKDFDLAEKYAACSRELLVRNRVRIRAYFTGVPEKDLLATLSSAAPPGTTIDAKIRQAWQNYVEHPTQGNFNEFIGRANRLSPEQLRIFFVNGMQRDLNSNSSLRENFEKHLANVQRTNAPNGWGENTARTLSAAAIGAGVAASTIPDLTTLGKISLGVGAGVLNFGAGEVDKWTSRNRSISGELEKLYRQNLGPSGGGGSLIPNPMVEWAARQLLAPRSNQEIAQRAMEAYQQKTGGQLGQVPKNLENQNQPKTGLLALIDQQRGQELKDLENQNLWPRLVNPPAPTSPFGGMVPGPGGFPMPVPNNIGGFPGVGSGGGGSRQEEKQNRSPGGVDMSLAHVGIESGDWPFYAYYGLMYNLEEEAMEPSKTNNVSEKKS